MLYLSGIGTIVTLFIAYVLNRLESEDCRESLVLSEESMCPRNDIPLQNALIHNITLSSIVYESYAKNKDYWDKEIDAPTLVYRFSEHMCRGCYYENMAELIALQYEIGADKVLLLPAYEGAIDNKSKLKSELERYNYKNIPTERLQMPAHKQETDYQQFFAIIDKEKGIGRVFFPQFGQKELTQRYFEEVKQILTDPPVR